MANITEKTWDEFRESGMMWWINRAIHLFGWAICAECDEAGNVLRVYPAHTRYRGFPTEDEVDGFKKLTAHVHARSAELNRDCQD